MLTEDAPINETKVEVETDRGKIYRAYTRTDLLGVLRNSSYGQVRGVYDLAHNEMLLADAAQLTHADIQQEAAISGDIQFTIQHHFGGGAHIDLGDNLTMTTSADEDDFTPAFARALGMTLDELLERFRAYVEAL